MDDSNRMRSDGKERGSQEGDVMGHPALIMGEVVPNDVCGDSEDERRENSEWSANGMGNEGLENFAVAVGKHFERGKAQKIKCDENDEARRDAEEKAFDRMMSE